MKQPMKKAPLCSKMYQGWAGVAHVGVRWVGHVGVRWGGSYRGGVGHVWARCIM